MEISAKLVKDLRSKTGAGVMDCKRALLEANGDLGAAEEFLRKKGLMDAAKKTARVAADGLVAVHVSGDKKRAAIIELNSETDFVARNEKFQEMARSIAQAALTSDSVQDIVSSRLPGAETTVGDEINGLISLVGENVNLRRAQNMSVCNGVVASYVHGQVSCGLGKIGALVSLEAEGEFDSVKVEEFGRKLAMHVAAASPLYLCSECVPHDVLDKEKQIFMAQANESGKTVEIATKMAEGRIKKFIEEVALCEQVFVMDGKTKIRDVVDGFSKESGTKVSISGFVKFVLGDGIEKCETNFADEVGAFIK
jgi:elongation factor Ts